MAELMQSASSSFVRLAKGEHLEGIITKLTPTEILVTIGGKSEALVLERDKRIVRTMLALLKVGDSVTATVITPESDMGTPLVSLRRFLDEKLWHQLSEMQKKREQVSVSVIELTRGGYVVVMPNGLQGFLPNSHVVQVKEESGNLIGKTIPVYVADLDRKNRKIIVSQKKVVNEEEFKAAVKNIKIGQKITATVSHLATFGIFATVPVSDTETVDGLIHTSELTWEEGKVPQDFGSVGQQVEVAIIGVDSSNKRLELSLKKLSDDPFTAVAATLEVDATMKGVVTKVGESGVTVSLEGNFGGQTVEGLIRKDKIPPTIQFTVGQQVSVTIAQVDTKKRKVLLVPVMKEKFIGYR